MLWWRRPDGDLVRDLPLNRQVMPYLMRGRNESAYYFEIELGLRKTDEWVRAFNAAHPGLQADAFHLAEVFPDARSGERLVIGPAHHVDTHQGPVVGDFLCSQIAAEMPEVVEVEDLILEIADRQVGSLKKLDEILNIRFHVLRKGLELQQITDAHHRKGGLDLHRQLLLLVGIDRNARRAFTRHLRCAVPDVGRHLRPRKPDGQHRHAQRDGYPSGHLSLLSEQLTIDRRARHGH